jgi:retron-type reverse transcriptase
MGSLLSPIIANIYMDYFEGKAMDFSPMKPNLWVRYVDDTNVSGLMVNRTSTNSWSI